MRNRPPRVHINTRRLSITGRVTDSAGVGDRSFMPHGVRLYVR